MKGEGIYGSMDRQSMRQLEKEDIVILQFKRDYHLHKSYMSLKLSSLSLIRL